MTKQIKSMKRVSVFGEVYTASREIEAMLDLVKTETDKITSTFLEPACGNGNFLAAILERKLKTVEALSYSKYSAAMNILRAVSSIYGVDIQNDNVEETRERIKSLALASYMRLNGSAGRFKAVWVQMLSLIVETNIICGNTLVALLNDGSDMRFSEWTISNDGTIIRDEVRYQDMIDGTDDVPDKHTRYEYNWYDYTYEIA